VRIVRYACANHALRESSVHGLKDTINDISNSSARKKRLCLSEALLLAPKCDDVTSKEGKFIKDALFQFISETQVKL